MNKQERLLSRTPQANLLAAELPLARIKDIFVAQAYVVERARAAREAATQTLENEIAKLQAYNQSVPKETWIAMNEDEHQVVLNNLPADLSANDY